MSQKQRAKRGRPNWFIAWPFEAALDDPTILSPENVPPKVRVFAPSDRHITALFLGDVTEDTAHAVWAAAAALEWAPIFADLGAIRMLGGGQPSAVSALVSAGAEQLVPLMEQLPLLAEGASWQRRSQDKKWAPLPHVTLARIQRSAAESHREQALEWAQALRVRASTTLDRLALYTWSTDRSRTLFAKVAERTASAGARHA